MQQENRDLCKFALFLPEDFEDYEWEVVAKGYFSGARLEIQGGICLLNFYDATRLDQELRDEIRRSVIFFESNLVIVRSVTRASMTSAVQELADSGKINFLRRE